jgi:hypothetical protein
MGWLSAILTCLATKLRYDAALLAFGRELGQFDTAMIQHLIERKAPMGQVERETKKFGGFARSYSYQRGCCRHPNACNSAS